MSTHINDLGPNVTISTSIVSTAGTTGNTAGASADFLTNDGNMFAIQVINGCASSVSELVKVQDSTDGSTWNDISGAVFASAATTNGVSILTGFQRTARYVRAYNTHASANSAPVFMVLLGERLKVV